VSGGCGEEGKDMLEVCTILDRKSRSINIEKGVGFTVVMKTLK
jgi:hypothetical protein